MCLYCGRTHWTHHDGVRKKLHVGLPTRRSQVHPSTLTHRRVTSGPFIMAHPVYIIGCDLGDAVPVYIVYRTHHIIYYTHVFIYNNYIYICVYCIYIYGACVHNRDIMRRRQSQSRSTSFVHALPVLINRESSGPVTADVYIHSIILCM